jgi:hypothetical protein
MKPVNRDISFIGHDIRNKISLTNDTSEVSGRVAWAVLKNASTLGAAFVKDMVYENVSRKIWKL